MKITNLEYSKNWNILKIICKKISSKTDKIKTLKTGPFYHSRYRTRLVWKYGFILYSLLTKQNLRHPQIPVRWIRITHRLISISNIIISICLTVLPLIEDKIKYEKYCLIWISRELVTEQVYLINNISSSSSKSNKIYIKE